MDKKEKAMKLMKVNKELDTLLKEMQKKDRKGELEDLDMYAERLIGIFEDVIDSEEGKKKCREIVTKDIKSGVGLGIEGVLSLIAGEDIDIDDIKDSDSVICKDVSNVESNYEKSKKLAEKYDVSFEDLITFTQVGDFGYALKIGGKPKKDGVISLTNQDVLNGVTTICAYLILLNDKLMGHNMKTSDLKKSKAEFKRLTKELLKDVEDNLMILFDTHLSEKDLDCDAGDYVSKFI